MSKKTGDEVAMDDALSMNEKERGETEVLDDIRRQIEKIRPFAQADGGDIEFVSFEDGRVNVRLLGACTSCPSSVLTLKAGVEARLTDAVPEVKRVETV